MRKELVTFKGNKEGLMVYCDEDAPWNNILNELRERLQGRDGAFFEGASVILDTGIRTLSAEQVGSLWQIFQENGLTVKSIKTTTERGNFAAKGNAAQGKTGKTMHESDVVNKLPTLIIRRNVRSGQDITYPGNVIVFGDVKPGSVITASGFIMVLGNLRGTVHAGAEGDEAAWIGALRLQPTQLRIANYITRAPDEEPQEPEVAQINGGVVVVRELKGIANHFDANRRN